MVEAAVCLAIALLLLTTWHVEWFEIPSGSMAETLLGAHRLVACDDCGREFRCGADAPAMPGKRGLCPNCGRSGPELASARVMDGDRLLVDKGAFAFRSPRRWELVAFRNPAAAGQFFVKRVAGLPLETLEVRHGDVYADGAIQRKGLDELRSMAMLVYDADFRPRRTPQLPPRWQGEPGATRWLLGDGRYAHPPLETGGRAASDASDIDWLSYRHWRRRPGRPDEAEETPITDHCGYNQTRAIVESYPVRDLLLSCRIRTSGQGRVALFATDGQSQFLLEWLPQLRRAELRKDGLPAAAAENLPECGAGGVGLELALVDRQVVLAIDGAVCLSHPYGPSSTPFHPTSRPLAIGSRGLGIEVWDLKLFRDVYYTPPRVDRRSTTGPIAQPSQYRLGAGEYFVLGDNSPISGDSREHLGSPGVPRELLIGKPFLVYFAAGFCDGGGFQVPDLAGIRYIR